MLLISFGRGRCVRLVFGARTDRIFHKKMREKGGERRLEQYPPYPSLFREVLSVPAVGDVHGRCWVFYSTLFRHLSSMVTGPSSICT